MHADLILFERLHGILALKFIFHTARPLKQTREGTKVIKIRENFQEMDDQSHHVKLQLKTPAQKFIPFLLYAAVHFNLKY